MKIKITKRNTLVLLMTLLVFLDLEPYFVWSHVNPLGYRIYTSVILITTLYMCWVVIHMKLRLSGITSIQNLTSIPLSLFLASAGSIVLLLYQFFLSGHATKTAQPFNLAMMCIHVGLMMFCIQDHYTLKEVFCYSKTIFAISLIPSLIFFVLNLLGVTLPAVHLAAEEGRATTGQYYETILGIAVRVRSISGLNRICGLYREPGFVGTIGALYLAGDNFNLKKRENKVIAIAGLCTFSLAFVLMIVTGYLLHYLGKMGNRKKAIQGITGILCLLLVYFIFMSIPFPEGSMVDKFQERFIITEASLSGDNRFGGSLAAEKAYDQFIRGDIATILLGYGEDTRVVSGTQTSIWQKVSSYKEYIFTYGFIGFGLMIFWLTSSVYTKYKGLPESTKREILVLLLVFLISIYQRPNVARFHYLCVLFGGASNLTLLKEQVS